MFGVDRAHLLTSALSKVLLPVFAGGAAPSSTRFILPDIPTGAEPLTGSASADSMFKADAFTIKIYKGTALWLFLVVQQTDRTPFVPCDFAYIGAQLEGSGVTLLVI